MMLDTSKNILIVGLGLIGGSDAKALRKLRHPSRSKKHKEFID